LWEAEDVMCPPLFQFNSIFYPEGWSIAPSCHIEHRKVASADVVGALKELSIKTRMQRRGGYEPKNAAPTLILM
jgi:hypothetical protein